MNWRNWARCAGMDVNVFFPVSTIGPMAVADLRQAKAVCSGCQVRAECLSWAMSMDVVGVWGGLSEQERRTARAQKTLVSQTMRREYSDQS